MSFGPNPWQQAHWDWRAAGNFMCGGAGAGLVVWSALAGLSQASVNLALFAGLVLIGMGLTCVWLEIGRPLRALNVYFNPRTSWMSREAFVAAVLMPVGFVTAVWVPALGWLALLLGLAFIFCQGRMLHASRGIPAWRTPRLVPLVLATGLTEGVALLWMLRPQQVGGNLTWLALGACLLLARAAAWAAYRQALGAGVVPRALKALDEAGHRLLLLGTALPLVLMVVAALARPGAPVLSAVLLVVAGAAAVGAGAWFKFTLITRAAFNQGFALVRLPVRGAAR